MKKVILTLVLVASSLVANAQFSVGGSVGLPTGDAGDITTMAFSIDAAYMMETESSLSYGFTASYLYYSGDDPFPNWSFLPIAGAVRYKASEKFSLGADVGYAIGLDPSGNDGGLYYKPVVSYALSETMSLNLSYSNVSDNGTVSNIGLGVMFGL